MVLEHVNVSEKSSKKAINVKLNVNFIFYANSTKIALYSFAIFDTECP